jgi:hypothetical protein
MAANGRAVMPQYAGFHSEKLVNIVQARLSAVRQIRPRLARGVVPVHNGLNADIEPGPKTFTKAEALDWTIILPFSQLGGLHGAQWSRSSDLKRIMEDLVTTAEFAKRRCDAHGR